jgi:hypothetical protein
MRMEITLAELEQAINYWRARQPSQGVERALSAPVDALAELYARMIFYRRASIAVAALDSTLQQLLQVAREQK